jgi:hypothetical protein
VKQKHWQRQKVTLMLMQMQMDWLTHLVIQMQKQMQMVK